MADTIINVNSGFYNAVNEDRTYYAEDMNRPYKRLVANGVFATPKGTPSTDLQVLPGGGMTITVAPGEGIFANKWFENPSAVSFNVPSVTGLRSRIDSVVVQIDNRTSGRVGSLVYRTGTASANPTAPAINTVANVVEYRLADVLVNPASESTGITADAITDYRGSANCPWVTALIQQPDTDALWAQYQEAYAQILDSMVNDYTTALTEREAQWSAFYEQVSTDISAAVNLLILRSSYEASTETPSIPVGVATYDGTTDALEVYVNGLMAQEGVFWTISGTTITFTNPIGTGKDPDRVDVVVYKGVTTPNVAQVEGLVQDLDARFTNELDDSGWTDVVSFTNGESLGNHNKVAYRKIGKTAHVRGMITNVPSATELKIFALPIDYAPANLNVYLTSPIVRGTEIVGSAMFRVSADAFLTLQAISGAFETTDEIPVCFTWALD